MNILVLGGGFAGVEAAIKLRKHRYEVTLIADRDFLFVYPVSIWIPVGKRSFEDTQIQLSEVAKAHGFHLIIDKITQIEAHKKTLYSEQNTYSFDYLFVALGMGKVPSVGLEHTHSICGKPEESVVIQQKLEQLITKGKGNINIGFGGNPKDPTGTVVRGGPAFELLFNISVWLKQKGLRNHFNITFFAPMAEPGKRMGDKAFAKMPAFFDHYRIKTHFGKKIKNFTENAIVFEDDSQLASDLTLFISGGDGHPVVKNASDLPQNETGFIQIDEQCRVVDFPNIYAIGDVAALVNLPYAAKQGHVAEVMADVAVFNFHQAQQQKSGFKKYTDRLHIICVMDSGDGAAFVMRTATKEWMIPMPIVGHWLKKAWGWYYKNSKLKRIPSI